MAFDAGSVVGHFTLDSSGWVAGANQVEKKNTSMTGSIFKANIAYDLFKKALTSVVNLAKSSVSAYGDSEKATAQLAAVLKSTAGIAGITYGAAINLASSLQKVSTFEDDAILSGENLLLTFTNIGKNVFPDATKTMLDMSVALGQDLKASAIQLGKALQDPILGITALRRVGVNFSDAQQQVIKQLVETNRLEEAQKLILKELQTEFGGSAAAMRDTFGGAVAALNNQVNDLKETFGMYIAAIGKPFVDTAISMTSSVNNFLTSVEGMREIQSIIVPVAGVLGVIFDVGQQLFGYIKTFVIDTLTQLKDGFTKVVGKGNEANVVFTVLGALMKTISIGFGVIGGVVKLTIDKWVGLINIIKQSVEVFKTLGAALKEPFNKAKWQAVGDAIGGVWTEIKKTAETQFQDIKDIVTDTTKKFATFGKDSTEIGKGLEESYSKASGAMKKSTDKMITQLQEVLKATKNVNAATTQTGTIMSAVASNYMYAGAAFGTAFDRLYTQLVRAVDAFGLFDSYTGGIIDKLVDRIGNAILSIMNLANQITTGILNVFSAYYDAQQEALDAQYAAEVEQLNATITNEDDLNAALEAAEKEYTKKSNAIKSQQWEVDKASKIASIIMATAQAVMQSYSLGGGWPWGLIPAGIMAGIGVAEVAIVASQTNPYAAATGGVFQPNDTVLVGEKGPELITMGSTSRVIPNDQLGMGGTSIENKFYGDINSDVDMEAASRILASRVKRAIRAA